MGMGAYVLVLYIIGIFVIAKPLTSWLGGQVWSCSLTQDVEISVTEKRADNFFRGSEIQKIFPNNVVPLTLDETKAWITSGSTLQGHKVADISVSQKDPISKSTVKGCFSKTKIAGQEIYMDCFSGSASHPATY